MSVIGDGGWGTTLAIHLSRKNYSVTLWGAFPENIAQCARARENKKFLPGFKIPSQVRLTSDIHEAVGFGQMVVLAVPSEYLASTLEKVRRTAYKGKVFVSVVKGINPDSFKRMSEIVHEHLQVPLVVLSGPTIAPEVAGGIPTTAVAACRREELAKTVQKVFNSDTFRIYTNTDVVGVEIGGSVKNVIALACGICDGLGLGTNTKAAILTRGLAEITRLGTALGGRRETFYGLAGLGDLATTCFSPSSRNRTVGEALGRGSKIKDVLGGMNAVAEGVVTAKAVYRLSRKKRIAMPIVTEVYKIIYENKPARRALKDLMNRSLKSESN
ncbi:MAG: NAD(P)-dependent glycerol-3-phosphate dehydrogenase [Candidatus Omnitrophica bacterium]|nr:NAD(P)-dependent glycerol-3-phosphate dehydrogenase [Candidatus Omnitrophota bacterium]MDE2222529.1 NAD(P)-dependent glycerol-3-phosphate dehydrogenase [Candidatus Omnitrophota bacterium]